MPPLAAPPGAFARATPGAAIAAQLRARLPEPSMSLESTSPYSRARRIDGRHLRSERTRLAIIEAYLELLRRVSVTPTASHIADQADCSVRSLFGHFSDLDALRLATADYAIAQGQAEAAARNVDGDRPTRIQSHVETRAHACEKWLPLWRIIASLDQVAELKARIVMVRRANITRMRLMTGRNSRASPSRCANSCCLRYPG